MSDNTNDKFILKLLNESLRTSEGDVSYDSDEFLEILDDSDCDPNYETEDNMLSSSDDEVNNPGPSTSKRGKLLTSTPKLDSLALRQRDNPPMPKRLFHDVDLSHNISQSDDQSEVNNLVSDNNFVSDNNDNVVQQLPQPLNEWNHIDLTFNVYPFNPDNETIGINSDITETMQECDPIHFFNLFFNDGVVNLLVTETNRYAQQCIQSIQQRPYSRLAKWIDCTANEIRQFFGIVMFMGLNVLPSIAHYWRNDDLYVSSVSKVMSRNRFELILRVLHCANNETYTQSNRLHKIEKLVTLVNENFKNVLIPKDKLCVDESMVPFLGRLIFRQYLKNKRHRYGVKVFKLCAEGGYCITYKIYSGKEQKRAKDLSAKVVMELVEPYLEFGRTIYTDNWYTSVPLAEKLGEKHTHLVGTLNKKRKENPKVVVNTKLNRGQVVGLKNKKNVVVLKWKDKRDVLMLTTKHGSEMKEIDVRGGRKKSKPEAVIDYNSAKAFIDYGDQMAAYSCSLRRSIKWYRKIIFDLILSTAVVNSLFVFKSVRRKNIKITEFKESLVRQLFKKDLEIPKQITQNVSHKLVKQPRRSKCYKCYDIIVQQNGRKEAQEKARKTFTKCLDCDKYLCSKCFFICHTARFVK